MEKNMAVDNKLHHSVRQLIDHLIVANTDKTGYLDHCKLAESQLGRKLEEREKAYLRSAIERRQQARASRPGLPQVDPEAQRREQIRRSELAGPLDDPRPRGTGGRGAQLLLSRGAGVPERLWDKDADECGRCGDSFGIFTRRHHCRGCGINVCDKCSPYEAVIHGEEMGYGSEPQRICKVTWQPGSQLTAGRRSVARLGSWMP